MSTQLFQQIITAQISSASVSLVASSLIAASIGFWQDPSSSNTRNGRTRTARRSQRQRQSSILTHFQQVIRAKFYSPYRRLIFGLSISDMLQSFSLVTGPFMVRSDVPQALWGLGNAGTCNINGFLFHIGMTAVPMYTLCLCVYYVCKIKSKMNDAQFATIIEKKMHIFIIVTNLSLYLAAMGMGIVNPGVMGNICTTAAYPTGCRQNPEKFGECDPFIADASTIYILINATIPFLCLLGILGCMAILFWHVLMMDRMFGRARETQGRSGSREENGDAIITTPVETLSATPSRGSREESQSTISIDAVSFPIPMKKSTESFGQNIFIYSSSDEENCLSASNSQASANGPNDDIHENSRSNSEYVQTAQASSTLESQDQTNRDPETISRLYKKELLTQACGYVAIFCTTVFIFTAFNIILISGVSPGKKLLLATSVLYPLGGFLNIIVYTRPSVSSFLRKCPECSRFQAFWLVLKAGGEVPDDKKWRDEQQHQKSSCGLFRLFAKKHDNKESGQEESGNNNNIDQSPFPSQETVSDLPFGMPSQPPLDESMPNSALGINGLSQSIDSANIAHRSLEDWTHLEGEGSRMAAIPEGDSDIAFESSELLVSQHHAVDVSSTLSSSASQKAERRKKEDWDQMWEDTFNRVRRMEE